MNCLHVHLNVSDLAEARRFYTALFGFEPSVEKPDYLKWKLDDPAVNLAVTRSPGRNGVAHLGIDYAEGEALRKLQGRMDECGFAVAPEENAHCCYARSDKAWLTDPAGVTWEAFHTFAEGERLQDPADECCADDAVACCA